MKTPEGFEETLRKVAEMGYETVQITPPAFTNARELSELLNNYGLHADSAFAKVYEIPEKIDEIEQNAKSLGTTVCRTDSISAEDRKSIEGYRSFAAHLNKCGKLLHERGLQFMYHFHSFEFVQFGNTRGIDILLNETDPEYVLFQPDVFWLVSAGTEPSRALKMFKGRAKYMHLKDYIIVPSSDATLEKTTCASAPVGTGNLEWEEILKTAREIGIQNFVVEDDMGKLDPFDSARISLKNMKKFGF